LTAINKGKNKKQIPRLHYGDPNPGALRSLGMTTLKANATSGRLKPRRYEENSKRFLLTGPEHWSSRPLARNDSAKAKSGSLDCARMTTVKAKIMSGTKQKEIPRREE
jgi:hypothetical protein